MEQVQTWVTGLQRWWHSLSVTEQRLLYEATVVLLALLVGKIVGMAVKAWLKGWGMDEYLRLPWTQPHTRPEGHKTPSDAIGYLCVATVWAGTILWLATQHQLTDIADAVRFVTGRVWTLAIILGLALWVSGWLTKAVTGILQSAAVKDWMDTLLPASRERFADVVTRAVGIAIYGFFFLLVVLTAADLFGMTTTAGAVRVVWELGLRLFVAAIALGVGWLGVGWVQRLSVPSDISPSSLAFANREISLGIIVGTIFLTLALLTGSGGAFIALLLVVLLAVLLFPLWEHVPDLWAALALKMHRVQEVVMDGVPMHLKKIGMLATELTLNDVSVVRQNREVLNAFLKGTSAHPSSADEVENSSPG